MGYILTNDVGQQMKFLAPFTTSLLLAVASAPSLAAPVTIDFAGMANGATGESAWKTLTVAGGLLSITATSTTPTGTAAAFAYLDRGTGGLGACKSLNATGTSKLNQKTNSGTNLCLDGSDDNVTGRGATEYEALHFVFTSDVIIDKLWFNNNHDGDGSLVGNFINIGGVATSFASQTGNNFNAWVATSAPIFVAAGTDFVLSYNNEQFYVQGATFHVVAEPASAALAALGLLAVVGSRLKRR